MLFPLKAETLKIIHTGQTRGISSSSNYRLNIPYFLALDYAKKQGTDKIKGFHIEDIFLFFHYKGTYIWTEGQGVEHFHQVLKSGQLNQLPSPEAVDVLSTPDAISIEMHNSPILIKSLKAMADQSRDYRGKAILKSGQLYRLPQKVFVLQLDDGAKEISTDPYVWEMILGLTTNIKFRFGHQSLKMLMIGKIYSEGLRRIHHIKQINDKQTLLLDSGNALEGLSSVLSGSLSLQRTNSLKAIKQLGYSALVPGRNELLNGIEHLQKEQDEFQLPLLCSNLLVSEKHAFSNYQIKQRGGFKIALVGITDPDALEVLKERNVLPETSQILPPIEAVNQALTDILLDTGQEPDFVIVLTNASEEILKELRDYGKRIHLILAEHSAPWKALKDQFSLQEWKTNSALILRGHPGSINQITIELEPDKMKVTNSIQPISTSGIMDETLLSDVMKVRHEANLEAHEVLIPDVADAIVQNPELLKRFVDGASTQRWLKYLYGTTKIPPQQVAQLIPPRVTTDLMMTLFANIMLDVFQSEVVVMDSRYFIPNVPGNVPKLLVYDMLKTEAIIESYQLTGQQLQSIAEKEHTFFGGLNLKSKTVFGRPLDPTEIYKTLILSNISSKPEIRKILKGSLKTSEFQPALLKQKRPHKVFLRDLILTYLETIKPSPNFKSQVIQLLSPQWEKKKVLFSLDVDKFNLNIKGNNTFNNQNLDKVRVTRVNSPDNQGFGGSGTLSFNMATQDVTWRNGASANFDIISIQDQDVRENQDDLFFFSQLDLNFFELNMRDTPVKIIPYLETRYDTEFTPTTNNEGQPNPRQAEISGILGFSIPTGLNLQKFKTGLLVERDFNNPLNNVEGGIILELSHLQPLFERLRWNNDLNIRYVLPAPNDNESDLGLVANWSSALQLSLTRDLALSFSADTFIFQGKLPGTSQVGASFLLGLGLTYDRLWKPTYGGLF